MCERRRECVKGGGSMHVCDGSVYEGGGRVYHGRKGTLYTHTSVTLLLGVSCVTKHTIMTNRTTHLNFTCTLVAPPVKKSVWRERLREVEGGGSVCEGRRESVRVTCGSREERVCEK